MAIKRMNMIVFVCDECDDELDTETDDFDEAKTLAKDERWRTKKDDNGDWINLCSECASG